MPSLSDVKVKITGVGKTKQITKAMNMVASAKLRGAQNRIEGFRPYANKFRTVLASLSEKADSKAHPLLNQHDSKNKSIIILVTSDRGLCGSLNVALINKALHMAKDKRTNGKEVEFICVGRKGRDAVRKTEFALKAEFVNQLVKMDFSLAANIGKDIVSDYMRELADEVIVIYSEFGGLTKQTPKEIHLLPMQDVDDFFDEMLFEELGSTNSTDYIYEPEAESLLGELLPRYINIQVYRALLDSNASEHAARMAAMDNATRNCDDMMASLTLLYNKTRQASITSDLMDIVSGAEALND